MVMVKIHKIINNNVVQIVDDGGREVIVMGRGIAFQKKVGEFIDENKIDKRFYLADKIQYEKFKQFLNIIPPEYIELADDIIQYAKITIDKKFSDALYTSLSDHIYSSITRFLDGVQLKNPMLWEIKRFYEPEFEVGMRALELIEERFKLKLPEDEAGFITMHLVDAELTNCTLDDVYEITKIIQDIHNIVRYFFRIEFDTKSVHYYRFVTHIRFFAQRLVTKTTYEDDQDDSLLNILKVKYKNSYKCVLKIEEYVKKNYNHEISNDEKLYLMVHIERMVYKTEQ